MDIYPTNAEAEEAILGGILIDPNAISRVADLLKVEWFAFLYHQKIYAVSLELHKAGKPVDLMTVTTRLGDKKELESVGGQTKMAQLVDRVVCTTNIDHYVELIKEKYQRRQLMAIGMEMTNAGSQSTLPFSESLANGEKRILALGNESLPDRDSFGPISDDIGAVFLEMESRQLPGLRTGIFELDKLIGGVARQDLTVIAARPGMGKTWIGGQLALQVARKNGLPVVFFSAEMSRASLTKRFLSTLSGVNSKKIEWNEVELASDWEAISDAVGVLSELPIFIDDTSGVSQSPALMRSRLRRIEASHGQIGLVILDYLQLLGNRNAGNRAQDVGAVAGECKAIAKEFNAPFVALAQINRGVESRNDKKPITSDLKDSGDIEQDADLIIMLYRDEYYNSNAPKGEMEIIVRKLRKGELGSVKVAFDPSTGRFGSKKA